MKKNLVQYFNKKVILKNTQKNVDLPLEIIEDINIYWNNLIKEKPWFTRGVIYDVQKIIEEDDKILIDLKVTDYAHYLYGNNKNKKYICKNCWAGWVIQTIDNYYILGITNDKTETPSELHLIGGCLDNNDINGEEVYIYNTATRELKEEIGIDIENENLVKSVEGTYVISGGEKESIGIIYKLNLKVSKEEINKYYESVMKDFIKNNQEVELKQLYFVKRDKRAVENLEKSDYNYIEYIPAILTKDIETLK